MSYRDSVPLGRPGLSELYGGMTRRERLLFWTAVVNLIVFVAIAVPLGGNALNGTTRNGHYYVMQGGIYTEVSRPIFIYSTIHTLSLFSPSRLALLWR